MTLTTFPQISSASPTSPDLKILNLSRLLTRLEHNLLSPSADLKSLRRNEYQRMRIAAVRLPLPFSYISDPSNQFSTLYSAELTPITERRIRPNSAFTARTHPPDPQTARPPPRAPNRPHAKATNTQAPPGRIRQEFRGSGNTPISRNRPRL
jgi:hypothetical protein